MEESSENVESNPTSWQKLVQSFTSLHIEKLETVFKSADSRLTKEEFFTTVTGLFPQWDCSQHVLTLFDLINDKNDPRIAWSDFLNFLVRNMMQEPANPVTLRISTIIPVPQTRVETVVKIVLIETDKYFCYALVSKHGRVGLYDGNLNFLTTYQLIMTRDDIYRKEEDRRRRNRWVTDAIFCEDVLMFVATNTARSIVIYEASGLKHVPMWLILSTPNIIQSLAYDTCSATKTESVLYAGDDHGLLLSFVFLQPKVLLLRKKHNDKISLFYWEELPEEKDFIVIKRMGRAHQEPVKRLVYCPDNETLISCSRDSDSSLIVKHVGNKSARCTFKMSKGCNCFVLSRDRKVLITGSQDGTLRLWNPIMASKPIGVLTGHRAAIVDLKIMSRQNLFMSCSTDGMFSLWDIDEQRCLQSFTINFPSFSVFGKLIEWGNECIYPGPKRHAQDSSSDLWERSPLLVACCNHIAVLKLEQTSLENGVLPPPPFQNSVLVPKAWKTSDDFENITSPPSESREQELEAVVEKRIKELEFILEKDLFADNEFARSDINFKIATLEQKKMHMQQNVARGAPYLALDLHEVHDLYLSPDLPVPNRKIKNIVENIERVLQDANSRDLIFSEPSSSRSPRSSRSSFVEFD